MAIDAGPFFSTLFWKSCLHEYVLKQLTGPHLRMSPVEIPSLAWVTAVLPYDERCEEGTVRKLT